MKPKRIEDIKREEQCPICKNGKLKLKVFYVEPSTGNLSLSYGSCSNPFCSDSKGCLILTDIIIKELILGEENKCPKTGWWIFKFSTHDWSNWIQIGYLYVRSCNRCKVKQTKHI